MIHYCFFVDENAKFDFDVNEDSDTSVEVPGEPVPEWVRLEHLRCAECMIPAGSRRTCPAALSIKPAVEAFKSRVSFQKIRVTAEIQGVKLEASLPAQFAVRSLVGLLFALSSCPIMMKLRPMAHFHLPFGGKEHTAFRHLGAFLIGQYLRQLHGLPASWDLSELLETFKRLHKVNGKLADRLREAAEQDAAVNSLISLDTFATWAEMGIEEHLARWEKLFAPYLER
ncbi:MAG: hypothetical protein HY897_05745 [Deltaproteobacteria bacterium]|nr:hypothetical protein [Deltaproteobacteria bacterium]